MDDLKYVPSKEFFHDLFNDRFAVEYILKNKKPGYFVEIGALDGKSMLTDTLFRTHRKLERYCSRTKSLLAMLG